MHVAIYLIQVVLAQYGEFLHKQLGCGENLVLKDDRCYRK